MNFWRATLVALVLLSASAATAQALQNDPHIGYAYPAGGRRGTSFDMVIGGQHLDRAEGVLVSGKGIRLEVGEHYKPLTKKEFSQLTAKLKELRDRKQEAIKKGVEDRKSGFDDFKELAGKLGLKDLDLAGFMQLRKDLFNPKRQPNPQIAEILNVRVTIAADAEPGRREVRVQTPKGFSNPIFIDVGQYAEHIEKEPNDSEPDASLREMPAVINGQIMPGDVDLFRFKARKGMRLVAAAQARALTPYLADAVPGWFQATLRLLDGNGKEVAYVDDFRFHPDPVLCYEVPADGEYVLEIKDAIYRGREDFVYRIALGEVPFVTGIFPLGGRSGTKTTVQVEGWNLALDKMTLDPAKEGSGVLPVSVRRKGTLSNSVPFQLDTLPECVELEPNDQPFGAQRINFPIVANGRIDRPGDWDVYRFEGRAGDEIVAEVFARRLESPLDSILKLTDGSGGLLAVNDDVVDMGAGWTTHHADSRVISKLPADGPYLVHVGDAQRKGGPSYTYRVRIGPRRPDFELRVVPSRVNAIAGTVVPITVYALRRDGFDGDITLKLHDAPAGFVLDGGWVPAGVEQVRVTLTAPREPLKEAAELRLNGHARIDGKEVCRAAVPAEDMMQAFIYHHLVPMREWKVEVNRGLRNRGAELKVQGRLPVKLVPGDVAPVIVSAPVGPLMKQVRLALDEPPDGFAVKAYDFTPQGIRISIGTDGSKTKPGMKGNLIVQVSLEFEPKDKDGKPLAKRVLPIGFLPAIPYEVVAKP